jgi:hypothetical protein
MRRKIYVRKDYVVFPTPGRFTLQELLDKLDVFRYYRDSAEMYLDLIKEEVEHSYWSLHKQTKRLR